MYIINGRFLTVPIAGVGRFAVEMCKALKQSGMPFRLVVPKKYIGKIDQEFHFDIDYYGNFDSHIWEQTSLLAYLRKQKNPLLINFSGLGPVFYRNKAVTVHDVSFFENPKWFSRSYYYLYKTLTPITCRNSKFIITVSEFSKSEIIKHLNIAPDKVVVIYNATDFHLRESKPTRFNYTNYILGVFSLDPRKNYPLLIKAFRQLKLEGFKLILVGKHYANFNSDPEEFETDSDIIFTGYVDDCELLSLYKNSSLFVYPSLYEGFGIPALEALVLEKKVLLSDIPVFKEVFGNSVFYFKNNSVEDLKEKILYLLQDSEKPAQIDKQTVQNKYSWISSAKQLIEKLQSYA